MKKLIFILATATALVFTFSCKKDSESDKSVLESLTDTYWKGNVTIQGSPNAVFYLSVASKDTLYAGIDSTGIYESPEEYGAKYKYTNPQLEYTIFEGPEKGKVVTGIVSTDGKSLTLTNVPTTGVTTKLTRFEFEPGASNR